MKIEKVAVVGAGAMGRGIAQVGAMAGYQVNLYDVSETVLTKAFSTIEQDLGVAARLGKMEQARVTEVLAHIKPANSLEDALKDVDLAIEAVIEDMAVKQQVFKQMDELTPAHAILATNTSTMSPTEIAAVTSRSQKVIAMHFFNPVPKMKLLEIVKALETSEDTVKAAIEVGRKMGKEAVIVNEYPGFIPSRINCLLGNEAFYMLQEGVASAEDIDKAIKLGLNYPMGPFEMVDLVGLDSRLKNLEYLHKMLGEKYRPCPLMIKYVKAGRLGRKTGRGVYDYQSVQ